MTKPLPCLIALIALIATLAILADAAENAAARKLFAQAGRQMEAEQFAEAEKTCREVLASKPPSSLKLPTLARLARIACHLDKLDAAAKHIADARAALKEAKNPRVETELLYLEAVIACERDDHKRCLALLKRATAASEDVILWVDKDSGFFINIRLLDDDSPLRKEFVAITDMGNVDKELRGQIRALCEQAKREGKRVLLNFDGRWCPWCRDMDTCLEQPEVKAALGKYVTLKIDVGRWTKHQVVMEELIDRKEIPALVILDGDGNRIAHLPSKAYEDRKKRRNDPQRLAELLREHSQ
ncbi:thioredoxin family protein [Planctomycetota bacterium]